MGCAHELECGSDADDGNSERERDLTERESIGCREEEEMGKFERENREEGKWETVGDGREAGRAAGRNQQGRRKFRLDGGIGDGEQRLSKGEDLAGRRGGVGRATGRRGRGMPVTG